jgi:integron integrase
MQTKPTSSPKGKKLLEQVSDAIRLKHYSSRTEKTYTDWIRRFILFHDKRHPKDMGALEIQAFLTHLATQRHLSASTQNQALSAVLFLYRHVLQKDIDLPSDLIRAEKSETLPVVLTHQEAMSVIDQMTGVSQLMTKILYGSGLRLMECLRLRVKDIDFGNHQIIVRDGKGEKDRLTMLPDALIPDLQTHLKTVSAIHQQDIKEGFGEVYLPYALARKYPNAPKEWIWQYLFPAFARSVDPETKKIRRHHMDPSVLQKAVRQAALLAKIDKPVSPHTFRHSFGRSLGRLVNASMDATC